MKPLTITLILSLLLSTVTLSSEGPKWSELQNILGKDISSSEVQSLVKSHKLSKSKKHVLAFFRSKDNSFSLTSSKNKIFKIFLRISPWPEEIGKKHWRHFKGALPFNIKRTSLKKDLIKMLGKPDPNGHRNGGVWMSGDIEISINFNPKQGQIDSISIFKKNQDNTQ